MSRREIDAAFMRWLEARLERPDASDEDAVNYIVGLALSERLAASGIGV
jgi:hypothetical protein